MSKRGEGAIAAGAALVAALTTSGTAGAFEVNRTTRGAPIHWGDSAIVLQIDPSMSGLTADPRAAVETAVAPWAGSEGAPAITVERASAGSRPNFDGRNVVYYYPDGYGPAGGALAITILSYDDASGLILDADIVFNGVYPFAILSESARPASTAIPVSNDVADLVGELPAPGQDGFDLLHVLAHETGHLLGMKDAVGDTSSLMYGYSMPGDPSPRTPTRDDRAGLAVLYGPSPGGGCGSSTVAGRRPDPSPVGVATFVLPLVGLLVGRRARISRGCRLRRRATSPAG